MNPQPKIELELTIADKILLLIAWFSLAFSVNYFFRTYSLLPETIPIHFGISGKVDSYGSKSSYLALIIIPTIIFLGLSLLAKIPHKLNYPVKITELNARWHYINAFRLLTVMQIVIVVIFYFLMWKTNMIINRTSTALNPLLIGVLILLLILPVIIYIIHTIKKK